MSLEIKRQTIGRTVRNVFLCAIAALLLSSPAALAEWKGAMQGTIVWPADAAGWKITGEPVRYRGKAIFGYIDGAGEVFIAYNYKELTVRRFERKGLPAIVAEAYEMGLPQDAFGVFTWDKTTRKRHRPGVGIRRRDAQVSGRAAISSVFSGKARGRSRRMPSWRSGKNSLHR